MKTAHVCQDKGKDKGKKKFQKQLYKEALAVYMKQRIKDAGTA
jgi:hypothetical protein